MKQRNIKDFGGKASNKTANKAESALYHAFLSLNTEKECRSFFHDLCTPAEIKAMSERFRVAQLLDEKKLSYREIHEKTGASLATIGRVARFLTKEAYQGYRLVLDRLKIKNVKEKAKTLF